MTEGYILYRSGYKHQLAEDYEVDTNIRPKKDIDTEFIALSRSGHLVVKRGYAWDGVSGPVLDTDNNLRASLVHDAFYQLIRKKHLTKSRHKDPVDKLFRKMCKEDGVLPAMAQAYYEVLNKLGNPATDPTNAKEIKRAPD